MTAFSKTFDQKGTFAALYAAQHWLRENGYSMGSTCAMCPCGVLKGEFFIAKWKNLTLKQREQLDGTLDGDFREGPLTLKLKQAPDGVQNEEHKEASHA